MPGRLPTALFALGMSCAVALAAPAANRSDVGALELATARGEASRGQLAALAAWKLRHPGHPLEAYADYWSLSGSLERRDAAEPRAFLARYPDTPLAESLRREWLKVLGAAGDWPAFRAERPRLVGDDPDITCYSLQERLARDDAEAPAEARALFTSGREAPAACDPVFAALAASGKISEADFERRARKLLAANAVRDAKRTLALAPQRLRIAEKVLDQAAADPAKHLARLARTGKLASAERELHLFAIIRLARARPEDAAERLQQLAAALGPDATRYAWGHVALHAAMAHHPRALDWYTLADEATLNEAQLAWRARAALRAGDWKQVLASIQALPAEDAREATWRYWKARAARALGDAETGTKLLEALAQETHFYGLLAAEEIGATRRPDWNGWRPAAADLERVRAIPALQRALLLYGVGLEGEGLREWLWAVRALPDRDLLSAAEVARLAHIPDRAINTADRTVQLHDYAQRYPTPHREALTAAARQYQLDEALLYGLIRQESRFMAHARSRVGATGLMQLMPATARWVARQIPVQPFTTEMLSQPEVNVHMGTYYFRRVLSDLGHPVLATAAYNAGPGRARRWRDERPLEGAIYAETIPFNETRDYVKKVVANLWFYSHRLTGQAPSLKQLLGTIPGRSGEPPGAAVAASIP